MPMALLETRSFLTWLSSVCLFSLERPWLDLPADFVPDFGLIYVSFSFSSLSRWQSQWAMTACSCVICIAICLFYSLVLCSWDTAVSLMLLNYRLASFLYLRTLSPNFAFSSIRASPFAACQYRSTLNLSTSLALRTSSSSVLRRLSSSCAMRCSRRVTSPLDSFSSNSIFQVLSFMRARWCSCLSYSHLRYQLSFISCSNPLYSLHLASCQLMILFCYCACRLAVRCAAMSYSCSLRILLRASFSPLRLCMAVSMYWLILSVDWSRSAILLLQTITSSLRLRFTFYKSRTLAESSLFFSAIDSLITSTFSSRFFSLCNSRIVFRYDQTAEDKSRTYSSLRRNSRSSYVERSLNFYEVYSRYLSYLILSYDCREVQLYDCLCYSIRASIKDTRLSFYRF